MIKVKRDLQKRVETFLSTYPTNEEYGGFFFTNRLGNVCEFMIVPNIHRSRTDTYLMPDSALETARKYAKARRLTLFAEWHNHPTPCVCSAQDCKAAVAIDPLYSVMISPTGANSRKEYVWYFYKGIKPEKVVFV